MTISLESELANFAQSASCIPCRCGLRVPSHRVSVVADPPSVRSIDLDHALWSASGEG